MGGFCNGMKLAQGGSVTNGGTPSIFIGTKPGEQGLPLLVEAVNGGQVGDGRR